MARKPTPEDTAVEARTFAPIALPQRVRRALQAAPTGARIEVLRDGVVYDGFMNDAAGSSLSRVRQFVQQSAARDGHAHFTVCVDDHEEGWSSAAFGDDGSALAPGAEADSRVLSYGARMEAVAFRALDAVNRQQTVTTSAVREIGKAIRQLGKSVKALSKQSRNMDDPAHVKLAAMEHEATHEHLELVKDVLPMFTGKARKGPDGKPMMPTFVKAVWKHLDETEQKRVLATDEGIVFRNAPDDRTARVALRALWDLVRNKKLELRPETVELGTKLYNGDGE